MKKVKLLACTGILAISLMSSVTTLAGVIYYTINHKEYSLYYDKILFESYFKISSYHYLFIIYNLYYASSIFSIKLFNKLI